MLKRLALVSCLLLPPAAWAGETITVHYVEVPVSVVGRDGAPVRGLKKGDFQLFDGRKRVDITSFDAIDFALPASLRENAAQPAAHRAFLILFDLSYSSPAGLARAQAAARSFVSKDVLAGDLTGVATLDTQRGYRLAVNFTTDRSAVMAAIDHPASFRSNDPLQLTGTHALDKREIDEQAETAGHSRGGEEYWANLRDVARHAQVSDDQFVRQNVQRQIDWLAQLAASLRNVRGRTQIVFLSEGFDARVVKGRSARDANEEAEEADLIMRNQWYLPDPDRRFGSSASLSALQAMAQAFRGSGVILHAIDIQGLRVQSDVGHGRADNNDDALFLLARPTGGEVFRNTNDLADSFARMLRRQEVVYVLGFQAAVTSPGKLHDLNVKLAGAPHGTSLIYRRGYFEGGTRSTIFEETVAAADVIARDLPQSDIRLAALTTAFPGSGARAQVPIVVDIDGADLLQSAKGNDLAAEIFVYAFDEEGAVRDRIYQRLALDVTKVGDKLRQNGVKYVAMLELPPGRYAVKTLVRTPATGKKGYVRSDVVVPKSGETVLLQPFVLDDPRAWVMVRGPERQGSYPFHVNGEPFVPSAAGRPPAGCVRKVAVFVWNAQPEELTWETTPHATLLAQIKGAAATKLVLQLDPATRADRFGVTIHKSGATLTASTLMTKQ